jgi:hypothetical protein
VATSNLDANPAQIKAFGDCSLQGRRLIELPSKELMWQQDAYRMVQKRAKDVGIKTEIGNHTFRAQGPPRTSNNNGKLEAAKHIANHESPRTTKLYDRRSDDISLDEVERIAI